MEKKKIEIGNLIGGIAGLVVALGVIWQIVSYKKDFSVIAKGCIYDHEPCVEEIIRPIRSIAWIDSTIVINDSLENQISYNFFNYGFSTYNERWVFTIENIGRTIEGLSLKFFEGCNFNGYYQIKSSFDNTIRAGNLEKIIEIGYLKPSEKVTITCWSNYNWHNFDYKYFYENTYFTHLNKAKIPIEFRDMLYFYWWKKKYVTIGVVSVLFLFLSTLYIGNAFGIRKRLTQKWINLIKHSI